MSRFLYRLAAPGLLAAGLVLLLFTGVASVRASAPSAVPIQADDPVAHGEYLFHIAGCADCHSPVDENFIPMFDQIGAGGRPFDLGGLGVVLGSNITQDEATGIGAWTDEEIERAIRTGVAPDGHQSFPVMPYTAYNSMADSDMEALIAYMRTIPPIENPVERVQILPPEQLPQLPPSSAVAAPASEATAARGEYLVRSVMACTDCHTPLDPASGAADFSRFLAGGYPYEGPWGIVYSANLTPDEATGLGTWSDDEIVRSIRTGVRADGRILLLMPWIEYARLSDEDAYAIAAYLRTLEPVENEVPAPVLNEGFEAYVEVIEPEAEEPQGLSPAVLAGIGLVLVVALGGAAYAVTRRRA